MKKGTGITIDEDLWEMVRRVKELNLSALVNRLLRNYFSTGMDSSKAALETRIKTLEDRRERHERAIREIDATLKSLGEKVGEAEKTESEVDRDLKRFVSKGGGIKKLTGLNYGYLRMTHGLSKAEVDEKLEEIAEPRRKKSLVDASEKKQAKISNRAKAKEEIEKRVYRWFIKPSKREKKPLGFLYKICSDDLGLSIEEVKRLGDEIFEAKGWSK